jgi:chaperonin GroES
MKNIKPLGNRVLIKRSKTSQSKGGILLPDSAKEKPKEGEVIAVGPGRTNEEGKKEPMHVKAGDRVLFSAYAGTEVKLHSSASDEEELLIMSEEDLLGIVQE